MAYSLKELKDKEKELRKLLQDKKAFEQLRKETMQQTKVIKSLEYSLMNPVMKILFFWKR